MDYLVGLNICKHIHRVIITPCQINNEEDAPTESTEQVVGLNEFLVESQDSDSVKSQTEDLLETLNIIKSALSNPDFKQDENVIKGLNTLLKKQLPLLTQAVEGRQKEPANKRAENQLRLIRSAKRNHLDYQILMLMKRAKSKNLSMIFLELNNNNLRIVIVN